MARTLFFAVILGAVLAVTGAGQIPDGDLGLDDGDPAGIPDFPFGITMDRDGHHAYVAICGNYGGPLQNNRRILKVNVWTRAVVAEGLVGLFPEDVAVTYGPSGAARHVFATASTDGTVAVLTPTLVPVATIALGSCGSFGTHFPFGIVAAEDGTRVYVTTVGGCGNVFVIDADPASPGFASVLPSFNLPGGHGRPALAAGLLVVPSSVFAQNFSLSQGAVGVLNPAPGGGPIQWSVLTPLVGGTYVAGVDSALLPDGHVLLTMNGEALPNLYEYDPATGVVVRTIPLGGSVGSGIHGLAVSPDGRLAVATSQDANLLICVDVAQGTVIGTVSTGANTHPNEVAFTADGSRLFVTLQNAPVVRTYRGLPLRDLVLAAPTTAALGSTWPLTLRNGDYGGTGVAFISGGLGPTVLGPITTALAEPFYELVAGSFAVDGTFTAGIPVPAGPAALIGLTFYVQAATVDRDGSLRLSNPTSVVVQ